MNKVFTRLVGAFGGMNETSTITIKMVVPKDTLHRGLISASTQPKADQESQFLAYVVSRTGYLNMELIDFDVEP